MRYDLVLLFIIISTVVFAWLPFDNFIASAGKDACQCYAHGFLLGRRDLWTSECKVEEIRNDNRAYRLDVYGW